MSPPTNTQMSLTDWEKTLSAYSAHVSHLSEIPLSPFDIDQIGRHLKALLGCTQKNQLKDQIIRYRSTWVVYMAAIAARNDDRGYWDALAASLGVKSDTIPTSFIGSAFLNAVKQLDLPDYSEVGGYRYVTPIRLHGGIPAYSLPDFFEHIVMPAVKEPAFPFNGRTLRRFTGAQLLEIWWRDGNGVLCCLREHGAHVRARS